MSTASASAADRAALPVSQRPVRADIGHLTAERGHLLRFSEITRRLSSEKHHSAKDPFANLKFGMTTISSPTTSRFALFLVDGPGHLYKCTVTPEGTSVSTDWTSTTAASKRPSADITDRLHDAAASIFDSVCTNAYHATMQFKKLDHALARNRRPYRDLFRDYVFDNPLMPVDHRERTLAVAYAYAAMNAYDYEPAQFPRHAIRLTAIHAHLAQRSFEQYCGVDYIQPEPQIPGSTPPSHLPERLVWTIHRTTEANDLGMKCAKRYGLVIAEDILNRPRR